MLQRIQTLFLAVALGTIAACFFIPFWTYNSSSGSFSIDVTLFGINYIRGSADTVFINTEPIKTLPLIVIAGVNAILAIAGIFYYKNRTTQIKINNYNMFLTLIFIGTIYLWIPYMVEQRIPNADAVWNYGLILPLLTFLSLLFANRFIKKDEKLVKSADRLR